MYIWLAFFVYIVYIYLNKILDRIIFPLLRFLDIVLYNKSFRLYIKECHAIRFNNCMRVLYLKSFWHIFSVLCLVYYVGPACLLYKSLAVSWGGEPTTCRLVRISGWFTRFGSWGVSYFSIMLLFYIWVILYIIIIARQS